MEEFNNNYVEVFPSPLTLLPTNNNSNYLGAKLNLRNLTNEYIIFKVYNNNRNQNLVYSAKPSTSFIPPMESTSVSIKRFSKKEKISEECNDKFLLLLYITDKVINNIEEAKEALRKKLQEDELDRMAKERKRLEDEARRRREEEQNRMKSEDAERQRIEEERQRIELERKRMEEEQRRKDEADRRRQMEEERKRKQEEEEKRRKEEEEQRRINDEMRRLEEEQRLYEEEMRRLEEEKRKYEEEQRKNEIQKIYLEEKQKLLDELERIKKSKRFIYDSDTTIYKNAETKTFYSEYIQKQYINSQTEIPTRNTQTKVFGSDETDGNVYIDTPNGGINTL